MWAIHRIVSKNGNLTAFARSVHGEPLPGGAADKALRRLALEGLATTADGRSASRGLTEEEAGREASERETLMSLARELANNADPARRRDYRLALSEMERTIATTEFAAFEFPGAGWEGDSTVDAHILLEV